MMRSIQKSLMVATIFVMLAFATGCSRDEAKKAGESAKEAATEAAEATGAAVDEAAEAAKAAGKATAAEAERLAAAAKAKADEMAADTAAAAGEMADDAKAGAEGMAADAKSALDGAMGSPATRCKELAAQQKWAEALVACQAAHKADPSDMAIEHAMQQAKAAAAL